MVVPAAVAAAFGRGTCGCPGIDRDLFPLFHYNRRIIQFIREREHLVDISTIGATRGGSPVRSQTNDNHTALRIGKGDHIFSDCFGISCQHKRQARTFSSFD